MKNYFILTIAPLCWAGDVILATQITNFFPPIGLAFIRWFIAFIILLPFTYNKIREDTFVIINKRKKLIILSFLGTTGFSTFLYWAGETSSAITMGLIQTLGPIIIAILLFILYKQKVSYQQTFGLSLCFIGASYIILKGNIFSFNELNFSYGSLIMFFAVILYSFYCILLEELDLEIKNENRKNIDPMVLLTILSGVGSILILPIFILSSLISPCSFNNFLPNIKEIILGILFLSIFPSIIAYLCWNNGIKTLGSKTTSLFLNLIPLFISVLVIIFGIETIKTYHLIGAVLIGSGLFFFNKKKC